MLRLQPDTHRIVVVGGTSAFDRHLMAQARSEFRQFEQRVAIEYLVDLPMGDLLAAVSRLPAQTVVVFVTLFRDGAGRTYVPHDVVSQISAAANAPVYVFVDQYLGRGAVGGHLYSLEQHGTTAAEIGLRVLQGDAPATIPIRELPSTANMFDARELARWHLDERRLPADSVVMNREPDFFDRYKSYIVGVDRLAKRGLASDRLGSRVGNKDRCIIIHRASVADADGRVDRKLLRHTPAVRTA